MYTQNIVYINVQIKKRHWANAITRITFC